ncbi:hypothetical protein Clacol_003997 [Clathrus columnatus]|uniref:tripeptidyl-peptidase II n=1 Tax=Clathrus columnatus TaxID=1419009 RepID=A0AAV5A9C6_9AGAM|nr:hypothetical protein Clacol_003997 [Clathrus columnatus]
MVAFRALFFLVSILSTFAKPTPRSTLVVHERRDNVPKGFVMNGPAPDSTTLTLRMALASNNLPGLETALFDVSTPGNKLYGQHLTKEEVEAFVAPSSETKSAVDEWLSANGIQATTISPAGDWLSFTIEVSKANELFNTEFSVFTNQATGDQTIRTLAYSLPADLQSHINLVHPTVAFPLKSISAPLVFTPKSSKTTSAPTPNAAPTACNVNEVDPACIQALYGVPATAGSQTASKIGVSGFIDQFAQNADLSSFLKAFRPDLTPAPTFALQTLDGGTNTQNKRDAGIEANLDTQYTIGVAGGIPVTFISVGENNKDDLDGFLDIINFLIAETSPPQVLSTSYGFDEPDLTTALANSLCNAHMQLGARGTSILFSSGDGGVSGSQSQSCTTFIPTFPSGCPFVTSVGATQDFAPETAADFSGGGFSNIFPIPSFQAETVSNFLAKLGNTNNGLFNKSGRGFPDISAQGVNVVIFDGGEEGTVDGTSCSTPIVSSTIALVNAERLKAGKSVLGFLNPLIYSTSGLFTDITSGDNPGCNTNGFSIDSSIDHGMSMTNGSHYNHHQLHTQQHQHQYTQPVEQQQQSLNGINPSVHSASNTPSSSSTSTSNPHDVNNTPGSSSTRSPGSLRKPAYGSGEPDDGYTLVFTNMEEFQSWRAREEEEKTVEFVKGDTHGSKAVPPRFKDHTKLVCARHTRSGRKKYVKKYPERQRKLPSRKIEGDGCPASISYKTFYHTEEVRACYNDKHSHEIGEANLLFTRRGRKAAQDTKGKLNTLRSESVVSNSSSQVPTSDPNAVAILSPQMQNGVVPPPNIITPASVQTHQTHDPHTIPPPALQQQQQQHSHHPRPGLSSHLAMPSTMPLVAPVPPTPTAVPIQRQPSDVSHERWERMSILFQSIRQHARGFEYPNPSVTALESVLIRLYLESPIGGSLGPSIANSSLNNNR